VVCRHCERWNLSPLEERWEAIEEAERLYRDTRKRVATDNIGLAKLRDGTTIVRIGEPLRPEFAAWRYGDQLAGGAFASWRSGARLRRWGRSSPAERSSALSRKFVDDRNAGAASSAAQGRGSSPGSRLNGG
jgi:hypothetical protein